MEEYQQLLLLERSSRRRKRARDGWSRKEDVVPCKGGGADWLEGQLLRDLRKMGAHGKVVLKSDQENAILDVLNDVCKQRGKENDSAVTLVESSPKGESKSNGIAERAVQDLEGVRTHKLDHEAKRKSTVRIGHRCIAWLVENVADINKFKIGQDGRTANERLKGSMSSGASFFLSDPRKTTQVG